MTSEWDGNGDETRYRYDSEGNIKSVIDAEQNVTRYTYDGLNRETTETIRALVDTTPTDLLRQTEYDPAGRVWKLWDRNGRRRHFEYDGMDRVKTEQWYGAPYPGSSGNLERIITFEYDKLGRVTREIDFGGNSGYTIVNGSFLSTVIQDDTVSTYQYDGLGRLVEETNYNPDNPNQGSGTQVNALNIPDVRQTYDYRYEYASGAQPWRERAYRTEYLAAGTPIGTTFEEYDELGRLSHISDSDADNFAGPTVAWKQLHFGYNTADDLTLIRHYANYAGSAWQNVFDTTLAYDKASRVTLVDHHIGTEADTEHHYTYDNASRITNFVSSGEFFGPDDRRYQYDNAGQLTAMTGVDTTSGDFYDYDENGNRVGTKNYSPNPFDPLTVSSNNRLTDDGTYTYDYDAEGNVVRRTPLATPSSANPVTVYGYDQRNRLTGVTQYASVADANAGQNWIWSIAYTYDLQGRRVRRATDSNGPAAGGISNEYFVYDGEDLSLRFGSLGELTHRYQYGPAVDQVLADETFGDGAGGQRATEEVMWLLGDQQGTVRDLLDTDGDLRKHIDYDAFGRVTDEQSYGFAVEQLFYYTGQEREPATGLYNIGVRWYDPRTGRWLSEDPSGLDGGDANFYRYVHNNPMMYVDPSGLYQQGNPLDSLFGGYRAGAVQPYQPISPALASGRVPVPTSLLSQPSLFSNYASSARTSATGVSLGTSFGGIGDSIYNSAAKYVAQQARTVANIGVGVAASLIASPPPTYAPPPEPGLFDRFSSAFNKYVVDPSKSLLSALRYGENVVHEAAGGTRIIVDDFTRNARASDGSFGRLIATPFNSAVGGSTRFVENAVSQSNVPVRIQDAKHAYERLGIDPVTSLAMAGSAHIPILSHSMTLEELATGQGNRPDNFNQILTRGEQFQNIQGLVTDVQFAGVGVALKVRRGNGGRGGGVEHARVQQSITDYAGGRQEVRVYEIGTGGNYRIVDNVDALGRYHQIGDMRYRGERYSPSAVQRGAIEDLRYALGNDAIIIYHQ